MIPIYVESKNGSNDLYTKKKHSHRCRKQTQLPEGNVGKDYTGDWD